MKVVRQVISLLLCSLVWSGVVAQNVKEGIPFNGLIRNASGERVKNIKIEVKSSGRYTYSDKFGRFGLTNVKADDVLILSYKDLLVEIAVGGRRSLNIVLADNSLSDVSESDELVEAGYGYIKRREVTNNNTGTISGEELRKTGVQNLERALLGRVPGLALVDGELTMRGKNSIQCEDYISIIFKKLK